MGALLLLVLVYDLRLTRLNGIVITDDFYASDIANYLYPVRVLLGQALRTGRVPLWTPLAYNGFPLAADPQVGTWYPINWLLFGLLNPATALDVLILLKFYLSGLFLYLYLRTLGVSPLSALFGALAFAWCGFFVVHMKHLNMTDGAMWVPLLLFTVEKFFWTRKIQWALATALAFGMQLLAGHPQISYYTLGFILCYSAYRLIPSFRGIRMGIKPLAVVGLGLLVGAGIGMVQALPTYELARLSERGGGVSYPFAADYAYYLPDLLTFLHPYVNGDPGAGTYFAEGIFWEDYGYVGLLPLGFALAGLLLCWRSGKRRSLVLFFAFTLLVAGLLMLGGRTPVFKLAYLLVPGMKYFRFPNRLILFVDLALCILASLGFDRVFPSEKKRSLHFLQVALISLTVWNLFHIQKRQNPVVEASQWEAPPETAKKLLRDTTLNRIFTVGSTESHKLAYGRAKGWEEDLTPFLDQREYLQPSLNMPYGLASADGYLNLVPRHLIKMWGNEKGGGIIHRTGYLTADGKGLVFTQATVELLKAFNVKYLLSLWEINHPSLSFLGKEKDVYLYENREVMPRAYLVPQAIFVTEKEAEKALLEGNISLGKSVLLSGDGSTKVERDTSLTPSEVRILSYSPEKVEVEVKVLKKAWLVLADTDYPGWEASIDGKSARIHRANLCVRAVEMQPGDHRVIFQFRPKCLLYGGLISLVSLLLWGVGIVTYAGRLVRPRKERRSVLAW